MLSVAEEVSVLGNTPSGHFSFPEGNIPHTRVVV
jgi:hypothetical protein